MKISVIGLGLIGGSIAKELHTRSIGTIEVFGVEQNPEHADLALSLNLVREIIDFESAMRLSDVIIVAVPVDIIESILPQILDKVSPHQVVFDVGSTKKEICDFVKTHPNRNRFVAAHPLAGTEFSGPQAALMNLFNGKKNIICERELSDADAIKRTVEIFNFLGMQSFFLESGSHDKHMAYVSHLSHVTSFALSETVLEIEKDEKQIFNLASTGFASTARLAKCNPKTWTAIFKKNPEFLSEALDAYIEQIKKYKLLIDKGDWNGMYDAIKESNDITRVLDGIKLNPSKS